MNLFKAVRQDYCDRFLRTNSYYEYRESPAEITRRQLVNFLKSTGGCLNNYIVLNRLF